MILIVIDWISWRIQIHVGSKLFFNRFLEFYLILCHILSCWWCVCTPPGGAAVHDDRHTNVVQFKQMFDIWGLNKLNGAVKCFAWCYCSGAAVLCTGQITVSVCERESEQEWARERERKRALADTNLVFLVFLNPQSGQAGICIWMKFRKGQNNSNVINAAASHRCVAGTLEYNVDMTRMFARIPS